MFEIGDRVKFIGPEEWSYRPESSDTIGTIRSIGSKPECYEVRWDNDNTWWQKEEHLTLAEPKELITTDSYV